MKRSILRLSALALAVLLWGCGRAPAPETTVPTETTVPATPAYTYREALAEPAACYSPLDYYTQTDSVILSYTQLGLYAPAIDVDSYALLPEMAAGEPVDVSEQYTLSPGRAWRIDLNPNACWEDGTPINADTYINSFREMLAGKHYRASTFFSSRLSVENAWEYYMQDQAGRTLYISLAEAGHSSAAEALNDGHELYLDMDGFWGLTCGWQPVESTEAFRDEAVAVGAPEDYVSPSYLYQTYLADGAHYAAYQTTFVGIAQASIPETAWEDVGFLKTGEYQITLLLDKAVSAADLKWELTAPLLVKEDLYSLDYGTSPERYASCGPYRLVSATEGELLFERNESWYGYAGGRQDGQYQATHISCRILSEEDAQAAFHAGELDTVTVSGGDEDALSIPQTYTSKLTFNTSRSALERREREGINKTILSYRDFRQAVSLSIDRTAFVRSCVPAASPTLGLLNEAFISDLETGEMYRDSEGGQQALRDVYGENATGFDPEAAAGLLQSAYDAALTDGSIGDADVVELEFLVYSDEAVYDSIVSFLQDALTQAARGTSLENRITILKRVDPSYYDTARTGEFEIILSTWGGSAADPWSILGCYCDREKSYEYGFDPSAQMCTITVGGTAVSRTYRGWYEEMMVAEDPDLRHHLLAQLEGSLLSRYDCVPIYERNLLMLDSDRITRPVSQALPLIGFGGVRYVQFTAPDGESGA